MRILGLVITGLLSVTAMTASAQEVVANGDSYVVGIQAGTTGIGVTGEWKITDQWVARGAYDTFSYNDNIDSDGITYKGDLKFSGLTLAVDYHPFSNGFFVTAGLVNGERKIALVATPSTNQTIGTTVYTPAEIGTLSSEVRFPDSSTVLGLGYDNSFTRKGNIHYAVLAGIQISSTPKASLTATGLLASDPAFQADLKAEEADLKDSVKDFKTYPVLQARLTYGF